MRKHQVLDRYAPNRPKALSLSGLRLAWPGDPVFMGAGFDGELYWYTVGPRGLNPPLIKALRDLAVDIKRTPQPYRN